MCRLDAIEARRIEEAAALRRWGKKGLSKKGRAKKQAAAIRRLMGDQHADGDGAGGEDGDGGDEEDEEAEEGTAAADIDNRIKQLKKMAAVAKAKAEAKDKERRSRSRPRARAPSVPMRGASVVRVGSDGEPVSAQQPKAPAAPARSASTSTASRGGGGAGAGSGAAGQSKVPLRRAASNGRAGLRGRPPAQPTAGLDRSGTRKLGLDIPQPRVPVRRTKSEAVGLRGATAPAERSPRSNAADGRSTEATSRGGSATGVRTAAGAEARTDADVAAAGSATAAGTKRLAGGNTSPAAGERSPRPAAPATATATATAAEPHAAPAAGPAASGRHSPLVAGTSPLGGEGPAARPPMQPIPPHKQRHPAAAASPVTAAQVRSSRAAYFERLARGEGGQATDAPAPSAQMSPHDDAVPVVRQSSPMQSVSRPRQPALPAAPAPSRAEPAAAAAASSRKAMTFADRVLADADEALAAADAAATRLRHSPPLGAAEVPVPRHGARTPPRGGGAWTDDGERRDAPRSPVSLPSGSPGRRNTGAGGAAVAPPARHPSAGPRSTRAESSRAAAGAEAAAAARAREQASRHMVERARAQAAAQQARQPSAAKSDGSARGRPAEPIVRRKSKAAMATGRGSGGMWMASPHPTPSSAQAPKAGSPAAAAGAAAGGWVGVGLQRLEKERAAEARIEARIRNHRMRRKTGEEERPLPDLAPSVLQSLGPAGSAAPGDFGGLTGGITGMGIGASSAAAGPPPGGAQRQPRPTGRTTMKLAAAAYGAPVVGKKARKRSTTKRRPRPSDQPGIAML